VHFVIAVREDVASGVVLFILVASFVVAGVTDITFRDKTGFPRFLFLRDKPCFFLPMSIEKDGYPKTTVCVWYVKVFLESFKTNCFKV